MAVDPRFGLTSAEAANMAAVLEREGLSDALSTAQTTKLARQRTPFDSVPAAVGDGVADDTAAIQAAITAAFGANGNGFVYLPYGLYKITDTLTFTFGATSHRFRNFGIISDGGVLKSAIADTAKDVISITVTSGTGVQIRHMHFVGLTIEGQGGATPVERDGISITSDTTGQAAYVFRFDRCTFESMGRHGVKLTGNIFEGSFNQCGFSGAGTDGINLANGSTGIISSIHISKCNFRDIRGTGVNAGSVINDVYYDQCDFISIGSYGVSQVNGIPLITHSHFENCHTLAAGSVDGQAAIACNNFITAIGCVAFASGAAAKMVNLLRTSAVNNIVLIGCWVAASGGAPAVNMVWLNGGGTAGRKVELLNCIGTPTASTPVVNFVVDGQARPIVVTAGRTITPQENGAEFMNTGASGTVAMTLPTQANTLIGMEYTLYVMAAQTFGFTPNTGVQIRDGGSNGTATTGTLTSSTIGDVVTLKALSATQWIVKSKLGTWTLT